MDKTYTTTIDFSLLTDTRDACFWDYEERFEITDKGLLKNDEIIPIPSLEEIKEKLDSILFQEGKEVLLPLPTFSAKKQNGRRMYKDARK
ncbi:hypothetical protein IJS64_01160 [bacterium]|jgi:tRNA U55 pseudouridine synthase TruB|nr:hypothetical protein [bacterium]MBR4567040.1 hypothetical protein [bacterium]